MGRRRKAQFVGDGVLVVDKPAGPTSHDVLARLRRRFKPAKLGHTGTLDPFATGVLVLAFNQATRLAEILGSGDKVYRGVLSLGAATDTGDPTGEVVERAPAPELSEDRVKAALEELVGPRLQAPPAYSAAKHQGKPLYRYAREGRKVEKPPKPITVHAVKLHALGPDSLDFEVRCSRGAYVRSLGEDLAAGLGTVGHMQSLRRLASLPFTAQEAVDPDQALDWSPAELEENFLSVSRALARCGLPQVEMDEDKSWQLRQGRILPRSDFLDQWDGKPAEGQAFRVVAPGGDMVAVLRWLEPGGSKSGRSYETIRVFPERPLGSSGCEASVSASGAE